MLEYLPLFMFLALAILLFAGYPVAFVLGGVGLTFAAIGIGLGELRFIKLGLLPNRIWGGIGENLILTAIPMFIFMGIMLEKSGVARELLHCLQVMFRRIPGGLALAVVIMGTIMAATTGIIGASVVMMTFLALPTMMEQDYDMPLATGTIAASGTLGILIPPSIMLVIMAALLSVSVGNLFVAAFFPGLILAAFYAIYIIIRCSINPKLAPALAADIGPKSVGEYLYMVVKSFVPPVFLIALVLGSIIAGWATPTEAAGVGAGGAILLAAVNGRLKWKTLWDVVQGTALTNAMLFGIFVGATCFSLVFTLLHGGDLVVEIVESMGLGPWGFMIMLMAIVFALGFFFDWIEITLIVLPVFAPIIRELDFGGHIAIASETVYWFMILMAVNLQTSFLTPPFGFALFYLKGAAPPGVKIQDVYKGIIPFVMLQLGGLAVVMMWPEIALWLPRLVFAD